MNFGASVRGFNSYSAVQSRVIRFFLKVGKNTSVGALQVKLGWEPAVCKVAFH